MLTPTSFKAFDATALAPALGQMSSFNETFDVELLIHLAQLYGRRPWPSSPSCSPRIFAATKFLSVDPGPRHLAMIHQIVDVYDQFVAPVRPGQR